MLDYRTAGAALAFAVLMVSPETQAQAEGTAETATDAPPPASDAVVPEATTPQPAPPVAAPAPAAIPLTAPLRTPPDRSRALQMEATLVELSEENSPSDWTTFVYLSNGVAFLGIGGHVAIGTDEDLGSGPFRSLLVAGSLLTGANYLIMGIRRVGATSTDEDRLVRFRQQKASGTLDPLALARYEGELQADAEFSRRMRLLEGWSGVAMAAAGQTLIVFTATSERLHDEAARIPRLPRACSLRSLLPRTVSVSA